MDDRNPPHFGNRLRQLRQTAGLTQEELAERAGISVKAISALERGRRRHPYPNTIRALASALGLTEDERAVLSTLALNRGEPRAVSGSFRPLLPAAPATLIGRDRELQEITGLLRAGQARMLTLTGAGGVGKTRLALETARHLIEDVEGRVAFVPLAPLGDPALVLPTVAQTLGVSESGDTSVREMLVERLRDDAWLLVLDNFEHILEATSGVADLLGACPRLLVVATSRAPLRIRAEHEYPVWPLALPEMSQIPTLDEVSCASSAQLFLERARGVAPAFELSPSNCVAVAAICRRLDGLPLAIELVAARMRFLSPTELLARLDHVLPLLVGGSRDLPRRQQTMQAAIGWSYDLLNPAGQTLLRRLSVFAGGWTLEAAEAVTAWGEVAGEDVIELLSSLVEQSLVVAEPDQAGTTRYRMLELIRQFAAQSIEVREQEELSDQHLSWCLSLAQRAAQELRGPDQQQWLDRLEQEHDNLRTALAWTQQDSARSVSGLQLATALWRFWETRGYLTEARRWLKHALAASDDAPVALRAEGLNAAGNLARDQGDHAEAIASYEASLKLRREIDDIYGAAQSLTNLGNLMLDQGQYKRATMLYAESLSHFRDLEKEWDVANALNNLGIALGYCGDYEQATELLEEALRLRERLGETTSRARTLDALGVVMQQQGKLDRAVELHEESLAMRREIGDARGTAIALNNLGVVARHRGNFSEAYTLTEEALQLRQTVGDNFGIAVSLADLAEVARKQGDTRRAWDLYRDALLTRRRLGIYDGFADCLVGLAAIAIDDGDAMRAARLIGASNALRAATNQAVPPVNREDYERVVDAVRDRLGTEDHAAAVAEGESMTLGQAVADALGGPRSGH